MGTPYQFLAANLFLLLNGKQKKLDELARMAHFVQFLFVQLPVGYGSIVKIPLRSLVGG